MAHLPCASDLLEPSSGSHCHALPVIGRALLLGVSRPTHMSAGSLATRPVPQEGCSNYFYAPFLHRS